MKKKKNLNVNFGIIKKNEGGCNFKTTDKECDPRDELGKASKRYGGKKKK